MLNLDRKSPLGLHNQNAIVKASRWYQPESTDPFQNMISFEGIDGCGKGTQINLYGHRMVSHGIPCEVFREPGSTNEGTILRKLLLEDLDLQWTKTSNALLFNAARNQLLTSAILPALEKGRRVILDRYVDSTIVYQGIGEGLDMLDLINVVMAAVKINDVVIRPRYTVIIDTPVEVCARRMAERNQKLTVFQTPKPDRFESKGMEWFDNLREAYLDIAFRSTMNRYIVVNGDQPAEQVHNDIVSALEQRGFS